MESGVEGVRSSTNCGRLGWLLPTTGQLEIIRNQHLSHCSITAGVRAESIGSETWVGIRSFLSGRAQLQGEYDLEEDEENE